MWNPCAEHLFEAHGLGAELHFSGPDAPLACLVLYRKGATRPNLDDIGLATNTERVRPQRYAPERPDCSLGRRDSRVRSCVLPPAPHRKDILLEGLLDMDQCALPGAIGVVLDRRDEDRWGRWSSVLVHLSSNRPTAWGPLMAHFPGSGPPSRRRSLPADALPDGACPR